MGEWSKQAAQSGAEGFPGAKPAGSCPPSNTGMEYIQLREHGDLPEINHRAPFKAVLAVEDKVSPERQREISGWLVAMGGMYLMVCGEDCASWQDSIRRANLERVPIDEMQPQQFVMVTIHVHERLRSVFRYASKHARHSHVQIDNLLAIHIANRNREVEYRNLFDKR